MEHEEVCHHSRCQDCAQLPCTCNETNIALIEIYGSTHLAEVVERNGRKWARLGDGQLWLMPGSFVIYSDAQAAQIAQAEERAAR